MKLRVVVVLLSTWALNNWAAVLMPPVSADAPASRPPAVIFHDGRGGFEAHPYTPRHETGLYTTRDEARPSEPRDETRPYIPNGETRPYGTRDQVRPSDSSYFSQIWNLSRINAPAAWQAAGTSPGPVIAVLDTGVDLSHPSLLGRVLPGRDLVNDDDDPSDDNGHGTHIAGVIAASADSGGGVAGISPDSRILPVKVLNAEGKGSTSNLARGIVWAADQGARIINLSLGNTGASSTLQEALRYAQKKGALIVAAAGNSYKTGNPPVYPAAYPEVVAVAATGDTDEHASYSSAGPYVGLAAPGGDPESFKDTTPQHWIASAYWAGGSSTYARMAGTSQAAGHVAGTAALVLSVNPGLTNAQVRSILQSTATDLGSPGKDDLFGYGRVDAEAAVLAARSSLGDGTPGPLPDTSPGVSTQGYPAFPGPVSVTKRTGW